MSGSCRQANQDKKNVDPWDFWETTGRFTTLQSREVNICNIANPREENPVLMLASVLVVISSQLTIVRTMSLEWSVRGFLSGAKRKSPVAWTVG